MRSIKQQFNYCIQKSSRLGQSKHSAKKDGRYEHGELYSVKTITAYRDTAKNLSNWLAQKHPEIKQVVEIDPTLIQEWVNDRSEHWSTATLENHLTHIKYLEEQAKRAYGEDKVHFYKPDIKKPEHKEQVRVMAMSRSDFELIRRAMTGCRSFAKDALEITYRVGLRVDEVAHLKAEHIDLANKTIYVSREGAKNGRARTVPIRDKDISYFRDLLERSSDKGYLTSIEAKSIDRAIRRYMKDVRDDEGRTLADKYPRETVHCIRKLYATERMQEERGQNPLSDKKEEQRHWDKVCAELGHGEGRETLYKTYCKG